MLKSVIERVKMFRSFWRVSSKGEQMKTGILGKIAWVSKLIGTALLGGSFVAAVALPLMGANLFPTFLLVYFGISMARLLLAMDDILADAWATWIIAYQSVRGDLDEYLARAAS